MRRALQFGLIALFAAVGSAFILPAAPVSQPFAFNHAKHDRLTCAGCHVGVLTGQRAGLPTADVCTNCHATAPASVETSQWERLVAGGPFWKKVTWVPEHVMFSHRRHVVVAALQCESCHADIGQRTTPPSRVSVRLDMNTCLACHLAEGASEDCASCHR